MGECNIGQRFGMLTVLAPDDDYISPGGNHHKKFICQCDCGNIKSILKEHIVSGKIKSCGCLRRGPKSEQMCSWHDLIGTRIYRVWGNMVNRCTNHNNPAYPSYGGRGITVCDEWRDFGKFYNWAMSTGYTDQLTIDRIDNDKGYYPENCRWADDFTQANNKRDNCVVTYGGETKTAAQWARSLGVNYKAFINRIEHGWDIERVFTQPYRKSRFSRAKQE